eukprot:GFYU01005568.1.p1 GENE.GFYU01005568.1~~GFYU01005568.1.p1  ORF type:complete len:444 (-),score=93.57 GFYU01005568.1:30-1295(-)
MACTCGVKPKRKYKRYVDAVFLGKDNRKNTSKLTEYAILNHNKLPKIGKYFHTKTIGEVTKRRYDCIPGAVDALSRVIQACTSELSLFDSAVSKIILLLLRQSEEKLVVAGCELLMNFAHNQDGTAFHKLNVFLKPLEELCSHGQVSGGDNRVRFAGISAMHKLVQVMDTTDHLDVIIPVVLDNMRFREIREISGSVMSIEEEDESLHTAAENCLKDVASTATAAATGYIMDPIFSYVTKNKLWGFPNSFAASVVSIVAHQSQHSYLLIPQLQRRLDTEKNIAVKQSLVSLIAAVLRATHKHISSTGMVALGVLLKHLPDPNAKHSSEREVNALQEEIIESVGILAHRLYMTPQIADIVTSIISHLNEDYTTNPQLLLRCALEVAKNRVEITQGKLLSARLIEPLLSAAFHKSSREYLCSV